MKLPILSAAIAASAFAIIALPSCKKEDSPSRTEQIVGAWITTEQGDDINNNVVWDVSERTAVATANAVTFKFDAGGGGTTSTQLAGSTVSLPFTWSLQAHESAIRLISPELTGGYDTTYQQFVSFSSTETVVRDTARNPDRYMVLKKQ